MKKLQHKIFNLSMVCILLFVSVLLYRESVSEPVFIEKKYVALTYDDGPSRLTTQALVELLNKYDASATFFINGNHANENKELVKHIYENIMYAELNTKSDYCMECGYDGEIKIEKDESGKLIWVCPNCGNKDQNKMSVARRTCGYIGTQFWNQGRTQEIKDRVLHL